MRKVFFRTSVLVPMFILCLAATLILSLGLHTLQVAHVHPDHMHEGRSVHTGNTDQSATNIDFLVLGEYMHLSDKKLFLSLVMVPIMSVLLMLIFFGSWTRLQTATEQRYHMQIKHSQRTRLRIVDHLVFTFSQGLLNPKLF